MNYFTTNIFGHEALSRHGQWYFVDTGELVSPDCITDRPCLLCGECQTEKGHDPCIADIPGVDFACCGHGVEPGYVKEGGHDPREIVSLTVARLTGLCRRVAQL